MLLTLKSKHIEQARSTEHFPHGIDDLSDPVQILEQCIAILDRLGFETRTKKRPSKYSSTLFGHVWWASNFDSKTDKQKAKVAVHETTHALQQSSNFLNLIRYPQPRQLWIAEVQAYGAGLRALRQMGATSTEIVNEARRNAESLWDDYVTVRLIKKSSFDKHTVPALMSQAGF